MSDTRSSINEQVVGFYDLLFGRTFSEPFRTNIADPLRRRAVTRQVEEAADAASQALSRFFLNQQLTPEHATAILASFDTITGLLKLEDIANPNITPESVVEQLLERVPCPQALEDAGQGAVYRVALHTTIQVLMLVGPVMAEWQKLSFSTTFEMPRRVVNRLNQINEQIVAQGRSGHSAADENYELTYRDYLLQRFHRIEAGTVRMTTSMDVDLRELFVMPRVLVRPQKAGGANEDADLAALMDLAAARKVFEAQGAGGPDQPQQKRKPLSALEQARKSQRLVIVGAPGSGKSTFFEWLQVKIASVDEELVMAGEQAIPLLLRVRQLDPLDLPRGSALIEKATASRDRATLMPPGWIERVLRVGRVLFMLDGLDETEPELRDNYVLPWLLGLCKQYPKCRFLVSSRPVGYPPGMLRKEKFVESDLLDFDKEQIQAYTRNWCTAVRLARNEPDEEARREGAVDGDRIVGQFQGHPYVSNLARNPLMLSAICLVDYFEGGHLPEDRVLLYRLCVEGLLHNWDQRRGIRSEFGFDEKLRVCREVALAMQADGLAEYEAAKVLAVFTEVLDDAARAERHLEHIRYRTGLLLERRPGVFAFAHLTFQEYLAARAVHEGNQRGITAEQLVREHADSRWREVIALYCGLATVKAAKDVIEGLIVLEDTAALGAVLGDSYLSAERELKHDSELRRRVVERIAIAPHSNILSRFPSNDVTTIANSLIGRISTNLGVSEAYWWLIDNVSSIDENTLRRTLANWRNLHPVGLSELVYLIHQWGSEKLFRYLFNMSEIYSVEGPSFQRERKDEDQEKYGIQAVIASMAFSGRKRRTSKEMFLDFVTIIFSLMPAMTLYDYRHMMGFFSVTREFAQRFKDPTVLQYIVEQARLALTQMGERPSRNEMVLQLQRLIVELEGDKPIEPVSLLPPHRPRKKSE